MAIVIVLVRTATSLHELFLFETALVLHDNADVLRLTSQFFLQCSPLVILKLYTLTHSFTAQARRTTVISSYYSYLYALSHRREEPLVDH